MPAAANRPRSAGSSSWTCSSRGMNGTRAAVGARTSSAARTAASPMAWICVAIPAAAAAFRELGQLLRRRDPDASAPIGRQRPVRLRLDVLEERSRPRPERPVGEALLPADPRPAVWVPTQRRAAAEPTLDRGRRGRPREARRGRGSAAVRSRTGGRMRERPTRGRGRGASPPGIVDADDPEQQEFLRHVRRSPARGRPGRPAAHGP